MTVSRREFLAGNAIAAMAAAAPALPAAAAAKPGAAAGPSGLPLAFDPKDPNLKYDLLVAGGTVIDPSQRLHARRDVAIKNGQIAALSESLPHGRAAQIYEASGNLVTPGLVDLHRHYFHQVSRIGLPADEMKRSRIGGPADLAVFRLVEGPVAFVDTNKHERRGNAYLEPVKTIRQGRPFGFPFPDPFTFT